MIKPAQSPARLLHIEGLRGIANAMVLVHHFVTPLLLAAMASWRWIESPLIARGRRHAY